MSDTKTTPKTPKQNTVAAAMQRIAELEAQLRKLATMPHKCLAPLPALKHYQFSGRVNRPHFGQALPKGVNFHSYVAIRLEDELVDGRAVAPNENDVLELLKVEAQEKYPDLVSVELSDVSLLPAGW